MMKIRIIMQMMTELEGRNKNNCKDDNSINSDNDDKETESSSKGSYDNMIMI